MIIPGVPFEEMTPHMRRRAEAGPRWLETHVSSGP